MFTNKHLVVALLVAPALAVLAWLAVDYFVAERPHAAKPGAAYSLIAKSNCRYASGQCDLTNADFKLTFRAGEISATSITMHLESGFSLQQATIGLVDSGTAAGPSIMTAADSSGQLWIGDVPLPTAEDSMLRIAVLAHGATYYAEVPLLFVRLQR